MERFFENSKHDYWILHKKKLVKDEIINIIHISTDISLNIESPYSEVPFPLGWSHIYTCLSYITVVLLLCYMCNRLFSTTTDLCSGFPLKLYWRPCSSGK